MKRIFKYIPSGILLFMLSGIVASCKKMVDSPEGTANIYLTAAVNNIFRVPDNPKNYIADKAEKKLHIPVYLSRSGLQSKDAYTVNVSADNTAAQSLIDNGAVNASTAMIAPAEVYLLPASVDAAGEHASFDVIFDATKLSAYSGKQLVLSVHISDPSKYALNEKLSTLNILLDVDPIMFGARVEVTDQYIKNSGHPFIASTYDGTRRGVLAEWTTSDAVKNYVGGTLGGFDNYGNGGFMSMERYSSPEIPNGKIYQTIELPAGKYELTAAFLDFSVQEQAYIMVVPGTSLPDIGSVDNAIAYTPFTAPKLEFILDQKQNVSIGVLANLIQDQQYFRLDKFRLYQYQGLWD